MSIARVPRWLLLSMCLLCWRRPAVAEPETDVGSIASLSSLSPSEAGRGLSVKLKATTTYYDHDRRLLFLEDADEGAMIRFVPSKNADEFWANAGDEVEVEGNTLQAGLKGSVRARTGRVVGNTRLPVAVELDPHRSFDARFQNRLVRIKGWVPTVTTIANRINLTLVLAPGRELEVIMNHGDSAKTEELPGAFVELTGVFSIKTDGTGRPNGARLYVHSTEFVQRLKALPITPIAGSRSTSPEATPEPFRIRGTVINDTLGQFLLLQDNSGSLRVPYTPLNYFNVGSEVEVFAFQVPHQGTTVLTNVVVKLVPPDSSSEGAPIAIITPTSANTNLATLSRIMQVRNLSPQEASRGYPVDVTGVVTFFDQSLYMQFVEDETSGIYVDVSHLETAAALRSGQKVRITGFTGPGEFAPILVSQHVVLLGDGAFPAQQHVSFSKLMSGAFDSQWVTLKGVVRAQWLATNSPSLALFAGDGVVKTVLPPLRRDLSGTNLVDASVEVHGVCRTLFDDHRRLQGVELLVPGWDQLIIHQAASPDPFTLPVKPIADLFQFHAGVGDIHRARLKGVVNYRSVDGSFYLQDGSGAIQIQPRQAAIGLQVGTLADVVGFPVIVDKLAMLQEAIGHTETNTVTIEPTDLKADAPLDDSLQASLVRIEGRILARFVHRTQELLTVEFGERIIDVILEKNLDSDPFETLTPGTMARFTGVCIVQSDSAGDARTFRLLLRGPADIAVITLPSWWTVQRTAWALGGAATVLLLALAWVRGLRRQVQQRTQELHEEIEQHKRTEIQLESEIVERKKMELEIERSHQKLVIASRQAGMAEVATSVLHNVGNVLNSVNVSCGVIAEKIRDSKFSNIGRVADMINERAADLSYFLEHDPKGRQLPVYLGRLAEHVKSEQAVLLAELDSLRKNIEHIKGIVAMQQNHAKVGGASESVNPTELVEDALRMNNGTLVRHEVRVIREYQNNLPAVTVDKHKVLQILVNLIHNAKNACDESTDHQRLLTVRVNAENERLRISVIDNGVGIPRDNLTRVFNHGFTTRKDGHGFGLHSGALAAAEMGGTLLAHSDGPGTGAEFTLALPLKNLTA